MGEDTEKGSGLTSGFEASALCVAAWVARERNIRKMANKCTHSIQYLFTRLAHGPALSSSSSLLPLLAVEEDEVFAFDAFLARAAKANGRRIMQAITVTTACA